MRASMLSLSMVLLTLSLGGCVKPAAVAIHPTSGTVYYTVKQKLLTCEQDVSKCAVSSMLPFAPVDAVVGPTGGITFLTSGSIWRCNATGASCSETKLGIADARSIDVSESGVMVVVGGAGELIRCDAGGCVKIKAQDQPSGGE